MRSLIFHLVLIVLQDSLVRLEASLLALSEYNVEGEPWSAVGWRRQAQHCLAVASSTTKFLSLLPILTYLWHPTLRIWMPPKPGAHWQQTPHNTPRVPSSADSKPALSPAVSVPAATTTTNLVPAWGLPLSHAAAKSSLLSSLYNTTRSVSLYSILPSAALFPPCLGPLKWLYLASACSAAGHTLLFLLLILLFVIVFIFIYFTFFLLQYTAKLDNFKFIS